jgi:teichuronic acid biosynthesis glycosyltransferase TuaC
MGACVQSAVAVGKEMGIPVASLAIGSDVMVYTRQMPVLWKQLGQMLGHVDLPVGVSQMLCDRMMKTGGPRRAPLLIYLGRDTDRFVPSEDRLAVREAMGILPDEIVAVYVGALKSMKGMDELAEASGRLFREHRNFRLICIGDGPAREKLELLQESCQAREQVLLAGMVSPGNVPRYLQAADFFVFPSYSEGMPQAVLEAMNCGLPVVATRVGGIPEAVIDGENGVLVDPKDAEQLEKAMSRMICDADFREGAGTQAFQYVQDKFDPDINAKRLADAFRELVD